MRTLSFIIPAKNEEEGITETLRAIRAAVPSQRLQEIIVADNGSADRTGLIAESHGACVITSATSTIAALRNAGASKAVGEVLVFLDADVSLDPQWALGLARLDRKLEERADLVSGAWCKVPATDSWIPRLWHEGVAKRGPVRHIGSGHLIVPRRTFETLGGFDETLRTGEDYDFCERARSAGIPVIALPELVAIHRGEPQTLREFFKRELWHGAGDATNVKRVLRSYVLLMAIGLAGLHALMILPFFSFGLVSWWLSLLAGMAIIIGIAASVVLRWGCSPPKVMAARMALIYVYLWGRFAALALRALHQDGTDSPRRRESS